MSATSFAFESQLDYRASRTGLAGSTAAGVKKTVKKMLNRGTRRAGKHTLLSDVALLDASSLKDASLAELDAWADAFLAADTMTQTTVFDAEPTLMELAMDLDLDDRYARIPAGLTGSLPDWMLEKLESAQGNAMDHLSLFEVKPARTALAYSEDFED